MSRESRLFVLQKHSPRSHTYVGDFRHAVDMRSTITVESLAEAVRRYIKSRPELKSWGKDVDGIGFVVHQLPQAPPKPTKWGVVEMANRGQLSEMNTLASSAVLEMSENFPELIFVFESLLFRFVLFQTIRSSRECLVVGRVAGLPVQNVHVIKEAARDYVKILLGSALEADVQVWEPQEPFKLDDNLTAQSKKELCDRINEEYVGSCHECQSDRPLKDITHRGHLIITFTVPLEEGELMPDPNEPPPTPQGTRGPIFNNQHILQAVVASQPSVDRDLTDSWSDPVEFLRKRYGLVELSGQVDHGRDPKFSLGLGLCKGPIDTSAISLFESVVQPAHLPYECDLSHSYMPAEDVFPHRSPNSTLTICPIKEGYLVTVNSGTVCPWKLLVNDPLTLLQIEREGWHLQRDGLVVNLIRKGLPFQILYPSCQSSTPPPSTPSASHEGSPTYADYLTYCHYVANFFRLHPHAHAAALCAGGILWRIAIDALPPPAEHQIIRPFHLGGCTQHTVNGQHYWTPTLSEGEQEKIVGVFKWAHPNQSLRNDSWWPRRKDWTGSGLDFGAWAPADESWYSNRKLALADGQAKIIAAKVWKGAIKYHRVSAHSFLSGIRAVAAKFILENRL